MSKKQTLHESHITRFSDSSLYDFVCVNCGHTDITGSGWGRLAYPCTKAVSAPKEKESLDILEEIQEHLQSEDWNDYDNMQKVMLKASAEIVRLRKDVNQLHEICDRSDAAIEARVVLKEKPK